MKKQVLFIAALVCMMMQSVSSFANDRIINSAQLPADAKTFIQKTFPGQTIAYAELDKEFLSTTYEVHLSNGAEVSFDKAGNWDKVECNCSAVPQQLVPTAIANYVKTHYPKTSVVKIDKERYGFDVELSNNLELKFNSKGQLIRIGD